MKIRSLQKVRSSQDCGEMHTESQSLNSFVDDMWKQILGVSKYT